MSEIKLPDVNSVLVAGKLTNDPVVSEGPNGTSVVNFYVTSKRRYRDNSGIWRESTCHVGVVANGQLANACKEILKKNNPVSIIGELQTSNSKNEDGSSKSIVEIRAHRIQFLNPETDVTVEELMQNSPKSEEPKAQQETIPIVVNTNDVQVEPTEFDFGYQDLKL
jgi:single-strand DNA-binding protein